MLCALNRERHQQLPSDRIELYEACCQILIERRDEARRVPLDEYPALILTYRQKRALLEDLAYWLIKNGWSEVNQQDVDSRFEKKLENMQGVLKQITGTDFRRLCIERTNIIREPVIEKIDFTHRTFQEFLAAKAILDEEDIGVLLFHAQNDQWREVIILAAGLASTSIREKLISELIIHGDRDSNHRSQFHFLAISCLETSVELEQSIKAKLEVRLGQLVPPQNMTDARTLAVAGEMAIPYLAKSRQYPPRNFATCVRALTLIGGNYALEELEEYSRDASADVADEMFRAWDRFNKNDYARRVLSQALQGKLTVPQYFASLSGFQYFKKITSLSITSCDRIKDLSPLANLTQLTSLDLSYAWAVNDLSPLAGLTQLTSLDLSYCGKVNDLSPLANLTQLILLNLLDCEQLRDLSPLSNLTRLTSLNLSGCRQVGDLRPLAGLTQLTSLNLTNCRQIKYSYPLKNLTKLVSLSLSHCQEISDFELLAISLQEDFKSLEELNLHGIPYKLLLPKSLQKLVKG